jgi:uronate dehydrogenase
MDSPSGRRKILLTGGCGKIGSYFARSTADRYHFRVVDRVQWDAEKLGPLAGESIVSDLQDPQQCRAACEGIDTVIHLAANANPKADFLSSLLQNNFLAAYHMFQAAKEAGCKRFIFASSVHAIASYPREVQVRPEMPVRPTSMYGVSKCFGESLAAHYAVNEGLPSIAIRIGAYLFPDEFGSDQLGFEDGYLHPDDFNHLLVQCIETPGITLLIAHAISNNRYKRIDLTETREVLGYQPKYDGFDLKR